MAIAKEVARVSGAVRCRRFGRYLGETSSSSANKEFTDFNLATILADTDAYIRQAKKKFSRRPSSQRDRH